MTRRRGFIWRGLTPRGQRFYGFDFGKVSIGLLIDGALLEPRSAFPPSVPELQQR